MKNLIAFTILSLLSLNALAASSRAISPGPDQKETLSIIGNGINAVYACQSVRSLIVTVADAAPFVDARGCSIVSTNTLTYEPWPAMPVQVHVDFKKSSNAPVNSTCDFYANAYATELPGSSTILDCRTP